jgi:UDP-N-acetylglucosamine 2-epimerase (non-hydrolysing)
MPVRIVHVVGARPNYMKIAPVMRELAGADRGFEQFLVNTGQHYDRSLSDVFVDELGLPAPDVDLGVGSGSHAKQTAEVMARFDDVLDDLRPDWVVVAGDVNSTLAATLVAVKRNVRVAHIEAGLRSGDLTMPEEVNRLLVDRVSELLFTHSREADANLLSEGVPAERIRFVGNVMIDSLIRLLPLAEARWPALQASLGVGRYVAVTLHRPANVDVPEALAVIRVALEALAEEIDVVFPVHPRTQARWGSNMPASARLHLIEPLGYLDFVALEAHAAAVLTDSGGIQEETTWLGVPCITVRPNTERPVTISEGTNQLVELDASAILDAVRGALDRPPARRAAPELWDGAAARRIAAALQAVKASE